MMMEDPQLARPITSAASADNLASMSVAKPEDKKGNLMRNQGSSIDLATLYSQHHQPGYGWTPPPQQQAAMLPQQPTQTQATTPQDYLATSPYMHGPQFPPSMGQFQHQAEFILWHPLSSFCISCTMIFLHFFPLLVIEFNFTTL